MGPMETFRKTGAPAAVRYEAAGLRWLAAAAHADTASGRGAAVVEILAEGDGVLETRRLTPGHPRPADAEAFGRALARTHAAGADGFGVPPAGWDGDGWMGSAPLPLGTGTPRWGEFYATDRVLPYLAAARDNGAIDAAGARVLERCAERLRTGELDAPQPRLVTAPAARLHGDLWGGNVVWAADGGGGTTGVLIDPAAQGGHAESDLAQLAVFGAPHLDRIVAAYAEVSPLADGWQERATLHQLHILIVHAAMFGGGYGPQTVAAAGRYV